MSSLRRRKGVLTLSKGACRCCPAPRKKAGGQEEGEGIDEPKPAAPVELETLEAKQDTEEIEIPEAVALHPADRRLEKMAAISERYRLSSSS